MHRNSQPRFYDETNIYFITTNTQDKFPFFKEDIFCNLFIENLKLCKKLKQFELYAFAIMPDHVHLLIYPIEDYNISQIMHAIKRHFSRNANLIIDNKNISPNEGEDGHPRLQGIIHQHNKKVINIQNQFFRKYGHNQTKFPPFQWQLSFHDHVIRNQSDFEKHYDYIHWNPEQHQLVKNYENYYWSSINPVFHDFINPA